MTWCLPRSHNVEYGVGTAKSSTLKVARHGTVLTVVIGRHSRLLVLSAPEEFSFAPQPLGDLVSEEFHLFISSTVNDLAAVRGELARKLKYPGCVVRYSEDKNFPVEPELTSHDACLAVVRRCHAFALLIGTRFGEESQVGDIREPSAWIRNSENE